MTRTQAHRYFRLSESLMSHGITQSEIDTLLRCSRALHTWAEQECNGEIDRDETTGKTYRCSTWDGSRLHWTADRETGALKRARSIAAAHGLTLYHQTDPRGCPLYLIRPGDVREGCAVDSCYNNGIAVCID